MDWKKLNEYLDKHHSQQDELLHQLERTTHLNTLSPQMLSGSVQGKLLEILSLMIQPKIVVEVGTFTGYAALCLAKGLVPEGKLYTIDPDEETMMIAKKYFGMSSQGPQIQPLIGQALDIIPTLPDEIDIAFIDANKDGYLDYYDALLPKMRKGGVILADNVLWYGRVWEDKKDKKTRILHEYNERVSQDARVHSVIIPLRDGIHIAMKK